MQFRQMRLTVMNPLVIKRFIQMKLNQIKTDKSDAKMISQYGQEQKMDLWHPSPKYVEDCKQLQTITQLYFKQSTVIKNKMHTLQTRGINKGKMMSSLKRQLKSIQKEIKLHEAEMELLIKANQQDLYTKLNTVPGIGKKTAILLIVTT